MICIMTIIKDYITFKYFILFSSLIYKSEDKKNSL